MLSTRRSRTSGRRATRWSCGRVASTARDLPADLRAAIAAALPPHETTLAEVCRLDTVIGQLFGEVAAAANAEYADGAADLAVSHGQTVYHWVEGSRALGTLQLGGAAWVAAGAAAAGGLDLRAEHHDGRPGGAAGLHARCPAVVARRHPSRVAEFGRDLNITVRSAAGDIVAYDIGPASALMDSVVVDATAGAERMDIDGIRGANGSVDPALLAIFLAEPYTGYRRRSPPARSSSTQTTYGMCWLTIIDKS